MSSCAPADGPAPAAATPDDVYAGYAPIRRCVAGVQRMLATQEVLATDEARIGSLGFNAAQVQQGSNDRGVSRRTKPVELRGAFSFETVARDFRDFHE